MAGERVLIVDDEMDVLELCKRILEGKGYQVRTAASGQEALSIAVNDNFDLLLTDIKMPGITGLDIAQRFKKIDPGIICVAMTGYTTMDMVLDALKLGLDEFVMKPFTPQELNVAVAKALEKERLRKENFRLRSLIPLFELNKTLLSMVDVEEILQRLLEIAQEETKADRADLYVFEDDQVTKQLFSCQEEVSTEQAKVAASIGQDALGFNEQLVLDANHPDYAPKLEKLGVNHLIATPLTFKGRRLASLVLARKSSYFAPSDVEFLMVLCGQASIALENARLFTEIEQAYQELQLLDHMKSEFINIAAHELRTPLTILMGYTTVLEEETDGYSRGLVSTVMRNAMRLRALIDDMLQLKYLESGVVPLKQDHLYLPDIVDEIVDDVSLLYQQKNLELTVSIPDDFPEIIADRQKLDLIILNLVDNAIKFTEPGGTIKIGAEANGHQIALSVSDTGIGIPKHELPRIFRSFYQVEHSLTREHEGIGLGLSVAKAMVEFCGGDIRVESEERKGTTFTVTLPVDNTGLHTDGVGPLKL